jgi:von Willebrand factor A domain-containing protein 8
VTEAAKAVSADAQAARVGGGGVTGAEAAQYRTYVRSVATEIRSLRLMLNSLEARETERVWLRGQGVGDLDESRLIEGTIHAHTQTRTARC